MAGNTSLTSKGLLVNSKVNVKETNADTVEPSTMLLLMNAVAEARNKNYKKCAVEFNQSFIEVESNEDLLSSKLLELDFQDLEILYQTLCSNEKNRRSSKQHDKKGSFKKKNSVEDSSYSNDAYDEELKSSASSTSIGRKKSQVSLSGENVQGKSCLRKAYNLMRGMLEPETQNEAFMAIVNIHLKIGNYYSCIVCCIEFKEKLVVEKFLCTLDDTQSFKISQICLFIASKETRPDNIGHTFDVKSRLEYSKLAYKLQPNLMKATEALCKLYRLNDESEKAFAAAQLYLKEINSESEVILLLELMCLVDTGRYDTAKTRLLEILTNDKILESNQLDIMLGALHILTKEIQQGLDIIVRVGFNENKTILVSTIDLLKMNDLRVLVVELLEYLSEKLDETKALQKEDETEKRIFNDQKTLLSVTGQLLSIKSGDSLDIAKIYIDCLYVCDHLDVAQFYLIKLVKENPNETLPMVYLANIRLKAGAYVASTQDFRALLSMYGKSNLERDLSNLSFEEREEIARVHRLHGFRYLSREASYSDATECFTVAICAINGPLATGLLLSRGYCYMHLNNFEAASADFKECLSKEEKLASALCARAVLHAVTTHVEEALRDFHEAFKANSLSCQQCLPRLPLEHVLIFSQMLIQFVKQGVEGAGFPSKRLSYDISEIDTNFNESNLKQQWKELDTQYLNYSHFLCQVFPKNIEYISTYIECLHLRHEPMTMQATIEQAIASFPAESIFRAWNCVYLAEQRQLEEAILQVKNLNAEEEQLDQVFSCLTQKIRRNLFDRVLKKAVKAMERDKHGEALKFYNIACILYNTNGIVIRGRMECYLRIGDMNKWLKDLNKLLRLEPAVHDLCTRATYFQKQGEEIEACEDFIVALELNETETKDLISINSNSDDVVKLFYNAAVSMVELNKPKMVTRLCEAGLKFDANHKGLRQLKERNNINKCSIQ